VRDLSRIQVRNDSHGNITSYLDTHEAEDRRREEQEARPAVPSALRGLSAGGAQDELQRAEERAAESPPAGWALHRARTHAASHASARRLRPDDPRRRTNLAVSVLPKKPGDKGAARLSSAPCARVR
jgi:hypothetical protein